MRLTPAGTSSFSLQFNSLPSAQGWTYFQGGSIPETSVFSVTGTSLIQNTIGTGFVGGVVGHSEGGLIAQQWWWLYGLSNPRGVVQVFSLDSPINGEYAATLCKSRNPQKQADCSALIPFIGVSHTLLVHYANLWQNQAANDQAYLNADLVDHLYTPVITLGDPLFDVTDSGAGPVQGACDFSTRGTNIGWSSQGLLSPACLFVGVDKVEIACSGDSVCSDGNSGLFGVPGDLWVHSWVKNSPLTIASVTQYVTG